MPRGDVALLLAIACLALFFAEMSARQEAGSRWAVAAMVTIITLAMLIWFAYG